MSPLLSISDLRVAYRGRTIALAGIDLKLVRGEKLAVIGESGSGKSTLALAVAGLLPAEAELSGTISWPGLSISPRPGKDIGYVFQDPGGSLDPVMPIGRQIAEVLEVHEGLSRAAACARAVELLDRVRLPNPGLIAKAFPHQLSGGQRQRAAIAAGIAARPALLVADEPTSALDTVVQAQILALIGDLVAEEGMTLLYVTHDIALAAGYADRIAVLRGGSIVETGTARAIIGAPRQAYTRQLLDAHLDIGAPAGAA